jgi:hypothetical protein
MQRYVIPALAAAVVACGAWLAPAPASAQTYNRNQNPTYSQNRNQGGATASGDPWLNENDFDYNQRHWLPGPGDTRQGYNRDDYRNQDRYGQNNGNWNDRRDYNNRGYYGQNNDYNDNRGYNPNYDNRGNYNNRYDRNYNQQGFGRDYGPNNRRYDDDDED